MKKKVLFTFLIGMLLLTTACGKKTNEEKPNKKVDGEVANTNENIIKEVNIDGLNIQNVTLIYDSKTGKSTYSADIVNTTEAPIDVKSFDIVFEDASGNELNKMLGFVGKTLQPNESYTIASGTGIDLSKAVNIKYVRNY